MNRPLFLLSINLCIFVTGKIFNEGSFLLCLKAYCLELTIWNSFFNHKINIMKKFTFLASTLLMAAASFPAFAATMSPGTPLSKYGPIDGSYTNAAYQVVVSYNNQPVHFNVSKPSYDFIVDGVSSTLSTLYLGDENERYEEADNLIFAFPFTTTPGDYTISIPAGLVANADGDTNPAQTISFTIALKLDDADATVNPPCSYIMWGPDGEIPAPEYSGSQLSDVTVGWDGFSLQPTGLGEVTAYYDQQTQGGNITSISIDRYVSIRNGLIHIDLSNNSLFDNNTWHVEIPNGYVIAEKNGQKYVNGGVSLTYIISDNGTGGGGDEPVPSLPDIEMTSYSPADTYMLDLSEVKVTWNQGVMFTSADPLANVSFGGQTYYITPTLAYDAAQDITVMTVNFYDEVMNAQWPSGVYTIELPAGSITNGEQIYDEPVKLEYICLYSTSDYTVEPDSDSSVSWTMVEPADLKTVKITYPAFSNIIVNPESWTDITVNYAESASAFDNYTFSNYTLSSSDITIAGNTLSLTLAEVNNGFYQINIPAMDFIMDNEATNRGIWLYYQVWTGMEEGAVVEGPAEVSSPYVSYTLTWNYDNIAFASTEGVTLEAGYPAWGMGEVLEVPASALNLIYIPEETGGGTPSEQADNYNALNVYLGEVIAAYLDKTEYPYYNFTLVLPTGLVVNEDGAYNPYQTFDFTIYEFWPGDAPECLMSAEENVYDITWEGAEYIGIAPATDAPLLVGEDGTRIELQLADGADILPGQYGVVNGAASALRFNFDIDDVTPGDYTLIIPEASVIITRASDRVDYINNPLEFNITFAAAPEPNEFNDEYVITRLDNDLIEIRWDDVYGFYSMNQGVQAYVENEEGEIMELTPYRWNSSIRDNEGEIEVANEEDIDPADEWLINGVVLIHLEDLELESGDYTLVIGARYFGVEDYDMNVFYNPEIVYPFNYTATTGVEGFGADSRYNVFTLQGVRLIENGDASSLRTLKKGLYIINGRKVAVK